jgi:hypothetical protein
MARDALASPFAPGPDRASRRVLVSAWSLATLVAPRRIAESLIERRFRQRMAG